jgi:hypothetical protein
MPRIPGESQVSRPPEPVDRKLEMAVVLVERVLPMRATDAIAIREAGNTMMIFYARRVTMVQQDMLREHLLCALGGGDDLARAVKIPRGQAAAMEAAVFVDVDDLQLPWPRSAMMLEKNLCTSVCDHGRPGAYGQCNAEYRDPACCPPKQELPSPWLPLEAFTPVRPDRCR